VPPSTDKYPLAYLHPVYQCIAEFAAGCANDVQVEHHWFSSSAARHSAPHGRIFAPEFGMAVYARMVLADVGPVSADGGYGKRHIIDRSKNADMLDTAYLI
jgi:hypothetical protein